MNAIEVESICNVHSHIREGDDVKSDLIELAAEGGSDVLLPMPNTKDGLKTADEVMEYDTNSETLAEQSRVEMTFIPTVLITEDTTRKDIDQCAERGIQDGKMLPLLRTTNSKNGVRHYPKLIPIVEYCGRKKIKVHLHSEHPWMTVNGRDAEYQFLDIVDMFMNTSDATIVWEHGTDARCIPFWKEMAQSGRFFVTLTAHHLATYEDAEYGDVRSVCKPPLKTKEDRNQLVQLVSEDHSWVMAGADDAPHDVHKKHVHEGGCACGAYTAPFLMSLYAHAVSPLLATDRGVKTFINFISRNGRALHGLAEARHKYILQPLKFRIPMEYKIGSWTVEPFWANRDLGWAHKRID